MVTETPLPVAPLKGIRVLDLTNVLSGPYCCYQLALMGAEVIKVEKPGSGDLARQLGADENRSQQNMGISYLAQNAGKQSITLNLKSSRGVELLEQLVTTVDVLVENYRPGVMDRLGIGYDSLKVHKPSLVYCAISGFGQTGPLNQRPAYDQIIQGLSGVMSITGDDQSAPLRVGYPLADTIGGMSAAFAVSSALHAKPRGGFIDVSMLETMISTMGWVVSNYLIGGVKPLPQGNENVTSAPSATFQTADGLLNIAANKHEQWVALASHLQLHSLLDDPRFITRELRKKNRTVLNQELEMVFKTKSAAVWEQQLSALGIPAGLVLDVDQALSSNQLTSRQMLSQQILSGSEERIQLTGSPFLFDDIRPVAKTPPPELGQDNETVFTSLGLSLDEISKLKGEGVI